MQDQDRTTKKMERRCASKCRAVCPHPEKTTTHRANSTRLADESGPAAHRATNFYRQFSSVRSRASPARSKAVCVLRGNANTRVARHLSIKGTAQYNKAFSLRPSPEPPSNLALNRTRYGMPALGLHFILAQARHAFAGRLALR
jgi:hypothetical protein